MIKIDWQKIKEEFPSIIFLTGLNTWFSFNFPSWWQKMPYPYNTIMSIIMSMVGLFFNIILFSSPHTFTSWLKFEQINESLYGGHIIKKFMPAWMLIIACTTAFIMWYKDFYHIPQIYYAFLYSYYIIFFVLLFRAARKDSHK